MTRQGRKITGFCLQMGHLKERKEFICCIYIDEGNINLSVSFCFQLTFIMLALDN